MSNEEIISGFLRTAYTDEKLAALLAHAEDGKLAFMSCCCFIGVATSDHALRTLGEFEDDGDYDAGDMAHYDRAGLLPRAAEAEGAYFRLADDGAGEPDDVRRTALIPLIRAEMARREAERSAIASNPELAQVV